MKKHFLSVGLIAVFATYVVYARVNPHIFAKNTKIPASTGTDVAADVPRNANGSARYKDGDYVGDTVDAFYGLVQVKTVIANGKITDVQILKYPDDQPTSIQINTEAMRVLVSEAINSQKAEVDTVTGATESSDGFTRSLASALMRAEVKETVNSSQNI